MNGTALDKKIFKVSDMSSRIKISCNTNDGSSAGSYPITVSTTYQSIAYTAYMKFTIICIISSIKPSTQISP